LKCPLCTNTTKEIGSVIGFGYLKYHDFKELLDNSPFIKTIELSNFGEIFLNPDLYQIIKLSYERKINLLAESGVNLNTISDEMCKALVEYKFKRICCSIDGATDETYKKYRVKGDLSKVIQNIKTINEYKKKYSSKYPQLIWQFILFGHNEHEIPQAQKLARELDMEFMPKLSWDSEFSPIQNTEFVKKTTGLRVSSREEFQQKSGNPYLSQVCHQVWEEPQINWDGKILGCCWNYWQPFQGNAFTDGLAESLSTESINHVRLTLLGKKSDSACSTPCHTCSMYENMKNDSRWLRRGPARALFNIGKYLYKSTGIRKLRHILFR
jgi:MoaA/NifB/PqqE/SkfB family radical SAM enzyme